MIKSVTLENFKSISQETYTFTRFDLLVGRNNSGKSTILQALAIWQYCVDEFRRRQRSGSSGAQIVLPNFTALPLPEFNLLWKDKTERRYPEENGKKKQEFIYINIIVRWDTAAGTEDDTEEFGVSLRYQSSQSVYAIPIGGWEKFKRLDNHKKLPVIVYVPPFSGLEPFEEWRDDSILRKQVGKAQPGSVLRNLLYRVVEKPGNNHNGNSKNQENNPDWQEIKKIIKRLFSIDIKAPVYEKGVDTQIICEFGEAGKKNYEIISGGSGFHQTLTLLAFMYGYKDVTTILFDEPDAHMHSNLQREMLDFFKSQAEKKNVQFIIATHSEELIKGVNPTGIISVLKARPERIEAKPGIITALTDVSNLEITHVRESPYILYVEGETDERILRAWSQILTKESALERFYIKIMGGGSKDTMKKKSEEHFKGLRQIVPGVKKLMLFDFDTSDTAYHPTPDNKNLHEWKRKNIENYLIVKDTWHRVAKQVSEDSLFYDKMKYEIDDFFAEQNLILPPKTTWKTVTANIFEVVDGKKILFENDKSLFQRLRQYAPINIDFNRETIALNMLDTEIHEDVFFFFEKLRSLVKE